MEERDRRDRRRGKEKEERGCGEEGKEHEMRKEESKRRKGEG